MVILFDQFNMPESVYELIFATEQQVIVSRLLIEEIKQHDGEISKTEMSMFATQLHDGITVESPRPQPGILKKNQKISYNKRQFYDRILTPMKSMGLIQYDMYKKTYRISENFNKNLMKVGLLWLQEMRKPAFPFKIKT